MIIEHDEHRKKDIGSISAGSVVKTEDGEVLLVLQHNEDLTVSCADLRNTGCHNICYKIVVTDISDKCKLVIGE